MTIPTRARCLMLMEESRMPLHIQKHSLTVTEIACYVGDLLNGNGMRLDLGLVEAGALLHDIAKGRCIVTGENHAEVGGRMVRGWGYGSVAAIVESHVFITEELVRGPITEALVVNYSDKRVRHDEIVTLEERFLDLVERYAGTREHEAAIKKSLELSLRLEEKIFCNLSLEPGELLRLLPGT